MSSIQPVVPAFTNVNNHSLESFFSELRGFLKTAVSRAGGGAALFKDALKIIEDAMAQPGGAARAISVIQDVLGIVSKALAAEQSALDAQAQAIKDAKAAPQATEAPKKA